MTHRQRFQTIIEGKAPDKIECVARLDIWYTANKYLGSLPVEVKGLTIPDIEKHLGFGRSARRGKVFRLEYDGVEVVTEQEGEHTRETFVTSKGSIQRLWYHPAENRLRGITRIMVEPLLKVAADYEVMAVVAESMRFAADYEAYRAYDREIGDDGYPFVGLAESPVHLIMLRLAGYENFYYHLQDFPAKVQGLLEALDMAFRQMWPVLADSPSELILHGTHFSSDMTPPPIFEKYFLPYFTEFNERMHEAGKKIAFHADANLTGLLEMVRDCGFDVADTFACYPLVKTTFQEAWEAWKEAVVIWGGVPSIILEPDYSWRSFKDYMLDLRARTDGRPGYIMAVSDNIMPGTDFQRLLWIRDNILT